MPKKCKYLTLIHAYRQIIDSHNGLILAASEFLAKRYNLYSIVVQLLTKKALFNIFICIFIGWLGSNVSFVLILLIGCEG